MNVTEFETPGGIRYVCPAMLLAPKEVLQEAAKAFEVELFETQDVDAYVLYAQARCNIAGFLTEVGY